MRFTSKGSAALTVMRLEASTDSVSAAVLEAASDDETALQATLESASPARSERYA